MSKLKLFVYDSLRRVFLDEKPDVKETKAFSSLKNDIFNCQVAMCLSDAVEGERLRAIPTVKSDIKNIKLFRVGNVPSEMPGYSVTDGYFERNEPGLFPDPLLPLDKNGVFGKEGLWYSLWIQIPTKGLDEGKHTVEISFESDKKVFLGKTSFTLEILPAENKKADLIFTQWFHPDCLCNYYKVSAFSKEHWEILENHIKTASENGINCLLTPLFTLPLDTVVGGERTTTQLVKIKKSGEKYSFDFSDLEKWVRLAKKCGIKYFEFSHFFTQWGAEACPKIVAVENGKEKKIFGWETKASGKKYDKFLSQFIPELEKFIFDKKLENRVFFHISDEPNEKQIESYSAAAKTLKKYLNPRFTIIDALSNHEFYKNGLVSTPVPATNFYEPFGEDKTIKNRWAYYCCSQNKEVSNRFFSMPQARNRIIGMQIYKYGLRGFLHWGYNFWYTQYSLSEIDPYTTTDAGGVFPSGDAFSVYPAPDGKANPSTRLYVFSEALSDLAALQQLEKKIGREKTLKLLEKGLDEPLTFKTYPHSADWLIKKRNEINKALCK